MMPLILSYYALFDTRNIAPSEVVRRVREVCDDDIDDSIINQLVLENSLRREEYNFKAGETIYTISPHKMVPTLIWLYETEEGHRVLDTLKPLCEVYDMEQTIVQGIVADLIRSKYTVTSKARSIFKTDLAYFLPVCDDSRFTDFFLQMSEATFVNLIKDTIDEAYRTSRLLNMEVIQNLSNRRTYQDRELGFRFAAIVDLYAYLAYGVVEHRTRRYVKVPETHLISAVYNAFHGHYEEALNNFREAQRLYNARTSIVDLRGIFPQSLINIIYILTCAHHTSEDIQRQVDLMIKRKNVEPVAVARVLAKILRNVDTANASEEMRQLLVQGGEMTRQWVVLMKRYASIKAGSEQQTAQQNTTADTFHCMQLIEGETTAASLLMSIYRQAPWETTLDTLMSKLGKSGKTTAVETENNERIAYFMEDIYDDLVTPRLQTITKSGTWSVGKTLAFHQFMRIPMQSLQSGDILIRQRNVNIAYAHNYKLTLSSVLTEMTDDSRLFVGRFTPYTLVTVTEEIPYLIVERVDGGFEVKSNVQLDSVDEDIIIISRGASSINFLRMTEELRPFFAHLLSMSFFPYEAEDKLKVFLAALGRKVEIHSPLIKGGTTLETVDGTSVLTLQMRPKGKEGYAATLFCRPLEGGRVQCRPGVGNETVIDQRDGRRMCVKRDLEKETEIQQRLYDAVPDMPTETSFETDAFGLLPIIDYLREHSDEVQMEWPEGKQLRIRQRFMQSQWRATLKKNQNGWFELEGQLQVDEDTFISMQQLMGLLDGNRSRFIKMGNGEFMALSESLRQQLYRIDALATRSRGHLQMSAFTAALLDKSVIDGEIQIETDDELKEVRQRILDLSDYRPEVPATLNATLRSYQTEGYQWIARLNEWGAGALLADDMGLGKTIQTIAYLLHKAADGPQLVVAPASVAPNWKKEFEKFAPSLHVEVLNFAANRSLCIANAGAGDVVITTYTLLLSVKEEITHKEWTTVCLDEAHVIKNRGAKTSGVCMKLKARNRIMLTGTPVQNHLGELWNLFQFVNPGLLGSYEDYGRRFITPIEVGKDEHVKAELERIVKPFMLRRTKESVLSELPEKTEIYQQVNLSDAELAVYEVIRQKAEAMLLAEEKEDRVSLNTLAEITRLRQAACSAKLVDKQWRGKSSKVEAIVEALEPIVESGDSALVFSQFTSFLTIVRQALDKAKIPYLYIDGSVPVKERQTLVEKFQRGDCPVFLISLKAGGLGLNLTRANYVFHLDPWWNPAIEQQATDRAHRIGQQQAVTVYHLLSANTIEEKIRRMHEQKRELAESILEGTDMSGRMSGKQLMELLNP